MGIFVYTLLFGGPCPTSPLWLLYQQPANLSVPDPHGGPPTTHHGYGGAPSPAMTLEQRLRVWWIALLQAACLLAWEKLGVHGVVARALKRAYPNTRYLKL